MPESGDKALLPTYAHCITGRPATRVLCNGKPLVRFDTIEHRDGSRWRYESFSSDNASILATAPGAPAKIRRFSLEEFGITVAVIDDERAPS